jgi:hypothetical protein
MGLGSSLTLITVGAILAFAVKVDFAGLDIQVMGYILMLAGLAAMTLTLNLRRRGVPEEDSATSWEPTDDESVIHDHRIDA